MALPSNAARRRGTDRRVVSVEQDRSAALLLRVWTEGPAGEFRGRVTAIDTSGPDATGEEVTIAVATSTGDLIDAVRTWLGQFAAPGS